MVDQRPDDALERQLRRAFAVQPAPAADPAFVARVRVGVAKVERTQRLARAAALALLAAGAVLLTPWVVELTLLLAQAALSPLGALCAMAVSLGAVGIVLRSTLR
jgi:hypothetical protein